MQGKTQGIYLRCNGLQEGRFVHMNHQWVCRLCWVERYKWCRYLWSNSENGDPSFEPTVL